MDESPGTHVRPAAKVGDLLDRYSGRFILAAVALTLLLIVPLVAMAPEEDASSDPGGDVIELQDDIDDRFQSLIDASAYIVEARGKDVLTQAALWELYQNTKELLAADERGELAPKDLPAQTYLYQAFDHGYESPLRGLEHTRRFGSARSHRPGLRHHVGVCYRRPGQVGGPYPLFYS